MKKLITFTSVFALFAAPALADEEVVAKSATAFPHGLELGVGLSATSGLNGFIGYVNKDFESFWWKRIGVRLDFASTKPVRSMIDSLVDKYMGDGVDVGDNLTIADGKIESRHFAALVDFYPFGDTWFLGGWRLTGGYVFGKTNVDAMLTGGDEQLSQFAGKQFKLGDTWYQYTGGDVHGTARAKWAFHGPYAGTGFDIGLFRGFKMFVDAGVVFTNKAAELSLDIPETSALQYSTDNKATWNNVSSLPSQLTNDIEKTIADAQDELDKYKFFPMVKIGFMYRF